MFVGGSVASVKLKNSKGSRPSLSLVSLYVIYVEWYRAWEDKVGLRKLLIVWHTQVVKLMSFYQQLSKSWRTWILGLIKPFSSFFFY